MRSVEEMKERKRCGDLRKCGAQPPFDHNSFGIAKTFFYRLLPTTL